MKKYIGLILAAAMALTAAGCQQNGQNGMESKPGETAAVLQTEAPAEGEEIAVITTSAGVIKLRLFPEEAPKAVENFKTLAKDGYYDGLLFHRVIEDFMIQTGDPNGNGTGGESSWGEPFEDEISEKLHFFRGAVAMANAGPNTNGSQFFIVQQKTVQEELLQTLEDARDNNEEELGMMLHEEYFTLDTIFPDAVMEQYRAEGGSVFLEYVFGAPYTIFGQVIEGMEVVDAIAAAETDPKDKPLEDIIMESITFETYSAE